MACTLVLYAYVIDIYDAMCLVSLFELYDAVHLVALFELYDANALRLIGAAGLGGLAGAAPDASRGEAPGAALGAALGAAPGGPRLARPRLWPGARRATASARCAWARPRAQGRACKCSAATARQPRSP